MKCVELYSNGAPCRFGAWRDTTRCVAHAAAAGDEGAKIELAMRGQRGRGTQIAQGERAKADDSAVSLRSVSDLLSLLERAARIVLRSSEAAATKANALQRIAGTAAELLKANDLESRNKELEALLLERHPELRKQLKAVP